MSQLFSFRAAFGVACLALLTACSNSNAEELPVWTPGDHDQPATPSAGQVDTEARKAMMPDLTKHGIDDVVLVAWKQNCVPCHGAIGRGDGPQGRALNPPDFTNPGWHKARIDSEMAFTIKNGKGSMPPFGQLPDSTVAGLVQLVRMLNPDRPREEPGEGAADTAPSATGGSTGSSSAPAPATSPVPKPAAPAPSAAPAAPAVAPTP